MKYLFIILISSFFFVNSVSATNSYSIDFETTNSNYLNINDGDETGLDFAADEDFSISFWVNFESFNTYDYILCAGDTYTNEAWYGFFVNTTNNKLHWTVDTGTVRTWVETASALSLDTWYHVVGIRNAGSDTLYLYINAGTPTTAFNATVSNDLSNNKPTYLGTRSSNGVTDRYFDGKIDEFAIYHTALTSLQVSNLYNSGDGYEHDGTETNLHAIWDFNKICQ